MATTKGKRPSREEQVRELEGAVRSVLEHAERIGQAVELLREAEGFADWLDALALNPDVSPLNAALIAAQVPGRIAQTAAAWKRMGCLIRKGEQAAGWITGPMFWPRAVFLPEQVGADQLRDLEAPEHPANAEDARAELIDRLSKGEKARLILADLAAALGLRDAA